MAIILVTYDLNRPGQNYAAVANYLKNFAYCKHLESVWLLDTTQSPESIRDALIRLVDSNDVFFVARLQGNWGSYNYGCAAWLNKSERSW